MTFDPDSLISSYLDGGLSPTDAQALCAWVKASPQNALRFSRRALVHGLSRQYFIGQDVTSIAESEGQELDRLLDPPPTEIDISLVLDEVRRSLEIQHHRRSEQMLREQLERQALAERQQLQQALLGIGETLRPVRHIVIPRFALYAAGVALAAMLVLLVYPMMSARHPQTVLVAPQPNYVATLMEARDALWSDEVTPIRAGSRIPSGVVRLVRGHVRLTMDNGAELDLIAPVTVNLRDAHQVELEAGMLIGYCPPQAIGFTVHTPGSRVVDLGTEFGVIVHEDQSTTASVFLGRVELTTKTMSASRSLRAGESAMVDGDAEAIVTTAFDPKPFVPYRAYLDLLHRNLIVNGDFEAGPHAEPITPMRIMPRTGLPSAISDVDIPGWVDTTNATTVTYEHAIHQEIWLNYSQRLPADHGQAFWVGREPGVTYQEIDLRELAELIDDNLIHFDLSGWLGGYIDQNDRCEVRAVFLDATGVPIHAGRIGPVTVDDRGNETGFLFRRQRGSVPPGTRTVRIELVSIADVEVVDAYADNLQLILNVRDDARTH